MEESKKDPMAKSLTDDGIQIDFNVVQPEKTSLSIRVSFELDSNVNLQREEQPLKHSLQRTSTDDGMQINRNVPQLEKAWLSI
jgi:hypothetical protein